MTCVGGSSTGFVTHIYIQGFDQVQGDRSRCDQNSDTAFDRRPTTRSVFMVEIDPEVTSASTLSYDRH